MKNCLAYLLLVLPSLLPGVEFKPWYPNPLQVHGELAYHFQSYASVDALKGSGHYSSKDQLINASLLVAYDPYCLQLETAFADTKKRSFNCTHIALAARYLFLDDNLGDPVSLSMGLSVRRAWKKAVNDMSLFYHGRNEAFLHAAIGKQNIEGFAWYSRWWGTLGIGTADGWTPWVVANAAYEWNRSYLHRVCVYINSLWGLGKQKLAVESFGGYGRIDHRSIDLGIRYCYEFAYNGLLSIDYARRVYAQNFPRDVNLLTVSYIYPFGPRGTVYVLKAYSLLTDKALSF
ncbi:Uncharacterized protein NEOC65_000027 [Neochlamydia sp. AcF65]|uniref:hypothetical protein n=1 Tax=Neochlamydia sp. AcF65 TaxID=2795735 RepID=UPI001BC8DF6A|nr:hypothetical protein [Neochlamydia sp. AcF65]MBS4164981.1 Uncharacterized protein [Neochlamydia sp. AcF65]